MPDIVVDGSHQVPHAAEGAPLDALASDLGEPALDLVEPGRAGGGKVQMIPGPHRQPLLRLGLLVGPVLIQHHMDVQSRID